MQKWISIKDQIPKRDEPILYCYQDDEKWAVGIAYWTVSNKWNPDIYSTKYPKGFTYWMPLPNTPRLSIKIKLITFVNMGTEKNPIWNIYGYIKKGHNKYIDSFKTEYDAIYKAHSYGLPVMRGSGDSLKIIKALDHLKRRRNLNEMDKYKKRII